MTTLTPDSSMRLFTLDGMEVSVISMSMRRKSQIFPNPTLPYLLESARRITCVAASIMALSFMGFTGMFQ